LPTVGEKNPKPSLYLAGWPGYNRPVRTLTGLVGQRHAPRLAPAAPPARGPGPPAPGRRYPNAQSVAAELEVHPRTVHRDLALIPAGQIERSTLLLPGEKVMVSPDLASLYGVAPRVLGQAVKRNVVRFPPDLLFQLTRDEYAKLKSQIVASSPAADEAAGKAPGPDRLPRPSRVL
jgi:hypothetical protein